MVTTLSAIAAGSCKLRPVRDGKPAGRPAGTRDRRTPPAQCVSRGGPPRRKTSNPPCPAPATWRPPGAPPRPRRRPTRWVTIVFVQRAMGFDVRHRRAGGVRDRLQRADLIHDIGKKILGCDVYEAPVEPGQVAIAHLRSDAHAALGSRPAYPQQAGGISCVETAGHVGAADDREHGVVVTEPPNAEALAQVGVEIDTGHSASLLRDPGHDFVEEVVDRRGSVLTEQAHPRFDHHVVLDGHRVRAPQAGIFFLAHRQCNAGATAPWRVCTHRPAPGLTVAGAPLPPLPCGALWCNKLKSRPPGAARLASNTDRLQTR
jgi:hypothetical protein